MNLPPRIIIVLASILLAARAVSAADGLMLLAHESWQDCDGLPQNTVQAISQTRDGYLWLGTEDGLARCDGVKFTVFNRHNTPALQNNYITALFESADGTLWVGTRSGAAGFFGANSTLFPCATVLRTTRCGRLAKTRRAQFRSGRATV